MMDFVIHGHSNVLALGALLATDTDGTDDYDVRHILDLMEDTAWKSKAVNFNMLTNPGFEDGDFTGWTAGNAVIDNTHPASGTWASKLVAAGSDVLGPSSGLVAVEAGSVYSVSAKVDVDIRSAGTHAFQVLFFDSSLTQISGATFQTWTAVTSGYETVTQTVGPSSASPDINIPVDTAFMRVHVAWLNTPTGTAYLDDVDIHAIAKYITVDLNLISNPGFGADFTGWTANSATIDTIDPNSGSNCSRVDAPGGAAVIGAHQDKAVDPSKIYQAQAYGKLSSWVAGTYRIEALCFDSSLIYLGAAINLFSASTNTVWTLGAKTLGPAGSGANLIFPAGTAFVRLRQIWDAGSTGHGRMDDVLLYEASKVDSLGLRKHNLWSVNAAVSVEYSLDDTEVIASWTQARAPFLPASDGNVLKYFTPILNARAWRIKIVTASIPPEIAIAVLGERLEIPYPPDDPFVMYDEGTDSKAPRSPGGALQRANVENKNRLLAVAVSPADRPFVLGAFKDWWRSHALERLPFFCEPFPDAIPGEVFWLRLRDNYRWRVPLHTLDIVNSIRLDMEGPLE